MAKLRFGVWIPTYAWADDPGTPESVRENVAKIRDSVLKCEEHGIDVWVIDHLLSAPGLYGNAWLEPLNVLRMPPRSPRASSSRRASWSCPSGIP